MPKEKRKKEENATYANERTVGHGEQCSATGRQITWHYHGEVLLRRLIWCCGRRRELGIEGARVEGCAWVFGWVGAVTIFGTLLQRDLKRNFLGARQAVLQFIFSVDQSTVEFR